MQQKHHYDLVVSLGANCSAAHNLRFRNMRPYSLPLDWVYIEDDQPIKWLVGAFKNKFMDFFQYENMKKMPATNEHAIIYKDTVSGYLFPNHFTKTIQNETDFNVVAKKMKRRVERLFNKIDCAKNILFILASAKPLDTNNILSLQKQFKTLYPTKQIDFEVLMFDAKENTDTTKNHIHIRTFERALNDYDFSKTNFEWAFLDEIDISDKPRKNTLKILSWKMFKRKYKMEISWKKI